VEDRSRIETRRHVLQKGVDRQRRATAVEFDYEFADAGDDADAGMRRDVEGFLGTHGQWR
jgi:hypothetical protein